MFPDNSPAGAAYIVTNDKGEKVRVLSSSFFCWEVQRSLMDFQVFIPHPVHEFRVWDSTTGPVIVNFLLLHFP